MHSKDPVLNQLYHALASTCHLTHPGRGAVACQGHISVMQWASEVEEGGFLSQFLMRSRVVSVSRPHLHVFSVKSSFSGAWCLIHWLTHPVFRRHSCDKGLRAVKIQPWGATILAMTYQDQVQNKGAGKLDPP